LISVRAKKDWSTPIFSYVYETASPKRLTEITDQFARTFVLQWPANSNYRMIATGFGGDRQTHLFKPIGGSPYFSVTEGYTLVTS
jgi:hypothetical protein